MKAHTGSDIKEVTSKTVWYLHSTPAKNFKESHTDTENIATEAKIQKAFEELSRGRTTLVIAHRLSTVHNADEIIIISEEGILERGNHTALLAQNGAYAALYHSQFRE